MSDREISYNILKTELKLKLKFKKNKTELRLEEQKALIS